MSRYFLIVVCAMLQFSSLAGALRVDSFERKILPKVAQNSLFQNSIAIVTSCSNHCHDNTVVNFMASRFNSLKKEECMCDCACPSYGDCCADFYTFGCDVGCPADGSGDDGVSATGDPHLINMRGEHFSIFREGEADLIQIPKGIARDLNIRAAFRQLGHHNCTHSGNYIAEVSLHGLWVEKNITVKTVSTGNTSKPQDLSVMFNQQEMWPFRNITHSNFHIAYFHRGIHEQGVSIVLQDLEIRIRQKIPGKNWSFLNFEMQGLTLLTSVGGILGTDDHSAWTGKPAECSKQYSSLSSLPDNTLQSGRGSWAFAS